MTGRAEAAYFFRVKLARLLGLVALSGALIASCSSPDRDYGTGPSGTSGTGGSSLSKGGASGAQTGGKGAGPDGGAGGDAGSGPGGVGGAGGGSCEPDARRCAGTVPELCDADGAWQPTETGCAFGCTNGACNTCTEGSKACEMGQAKLCKGGVWQYMPCEAQCQDGACVDACTTGARQCDGLDKVQVCRAGAFVLDSTCDGICSNGACVGVCKPDSARCNADAPNTPELCSAQGEWVSGQCSGALNACLDGKCVNCNAGAKRCSILGRPQTCSEFGSWADDAPCSGTMPVCVAGACVECEPATRRCNAGRPQLCNAMGAWVDQAPCSGATPACVAETGQCGTCQTGSVQCGNATTPQACDASGKWVDQEACKGSTPQCLGGGCVECAPNTTRCVGSTPQVCSSNGAWVSQAACSGSTPQCLPTTGQCGCTKGDVACQDSNTPLVCSAEGAWVAQADCRGDTPVCSAGTCVCMEGAQECTSATAPRVCKGGVWQASTCSGTTPACVAGNCRECSPGATRCSKDGLNAETCSTDGLWKSTACTGLCSAGACINVPCTEQPLLTGAYNFRCRASAVATTPGGTLLAQDYLLSGWWGPPCQTYDIGSASVFVYQGNTFMRYQSVTRAATTDAGTKRTGTYWLQPGTGGAMRITEMCDPTTKGVSTVGTFEQTATSLTLTFSTYQQSWTIPQ